MSDLGSIGKVLRDLARLDPRAEEFAAAHERGTAELQELAHSLHHYSDALDLDPATLAQLEARVSLIETLKRKYGGSVEAVLAFGADAAARLQKIESRGGELARLEKEIAAGRAELETLGKKLSKARATAAPALTKSVTGQLRDLGFQRSEFTRRAASARGARRLRTGSRRVPLRAESRRAGQAAARHRLLG